MTLLKTKIGRRSFLKTSAAAGGGLLIQVSWLASCSPSTTKEEVLAMPDEWFKLNAFIRIGENGAVTLMSPNPEAGQNIKTSMPMIVAEELDVDWNKVIVEQAPLDTASFSLQFLGGSQAIRRGWTPLRMAGAAGRYMLRKAAADQWKVPVEEVTTEKGRLFHQKSGQSAGYGDLASAAASVAIPEKIEVKALQEFSLIGTSQKNVDGRKIVTGQPLFGIDTRKEGMLTAMIVHPPAFGMKYKSMDASEVKKMPGIRDVFPLKVLDDSYIRQHFDTCTFLEVVAIVGDSTWQVMQAKKALVVEWAPFDTYEEERVYFGQQTPVTLTIPAGLESTTDHLAYLEDEKAHAIRTERKDGDPEQTFKNASKIVERTFTAPFLAHNCMEPMNFFADVRNGSANLEGPLQKPELTEQALSKRLGIPIENIDIKMTRLGGGYGRRSYSHWLIEAAVISQKMNAPVKLVYSREDDMTGGIYRPMYQATFRAALDDSNNLIGFHVNAGGIPESPLHANRFPAGAVDHYLAESWYKPSNISIGSFRAPRSNFMGAVEQAFLDEVAEAAGKDPIQFRLELLKRAKDYPVGERNDYDAERYAGVLELVRDRSNWGKNGPEKRGVAAYFCHNTYAAHVVELTDQMGSPRVDKVTCAVDCGIVINPDAATNLAEGAIVDGIGTAMYGELKFDNGRPASSNYDRYRMIRMNESPKEIEVHFVENEIDPTGMGEPPYPPVMAALANALYQATGKRYDRQPFIG